MAKIDQIKNYLIILFEREKSDEKFYTKIFENEWQTNGHKQKEQTQRNTEAVLKQKYH